MKTQIRNVQLLASLPQEELDLLVASMRPVRLPADAILIREGERGESFYLIVDGNMEVVKAIGTGEELILDTKGPGDYLGEMSLLDPDGLRTASVRTVGPATLLEMTRRAFEDLLQRRPVLAYEIARELSRRLRDSDDTTIRELKQKNKELDRAYRDLMTAQEGIIEKEKLERELQVAREIQYSILPRELPGLEGFGFGAKMVAARAVGGDFFDFVPLDADHVGVAVGDVSGKGVPAAIFMAMTRSLMRVEAKRAHSPREALEAVNLGLLDMNDAGMFVTILYGVLDRATGAFSYVRAGHTPPMICEPGRSARTPPVAPGQPLGILPEPVLDQQVLPLPPGGVILIYTDGITEAMDPCNQVFGMKRLEEFTGGNRTLPPQDLCDAITEAVLAYQGPVPQSDDITLVAIRRL